MIILIQQLSIPEVAKHLHLYPELSDGPVREFWEADKIRELDLDLLTPMYAQGHHHFYVCELAQLDTKDFVVPLRWITINGTIFADSVLVENIGSEVC